MVWVKSKCVGSLILFALLVSPSLGHCGWTLWVSTYDECMDKYLEDTKCNRGARALAMACNNLYGENKAPQSKTDYYQCIIDKAITMENDIAVSLAIRKCFEKNK